MLEQLLEGGSWAGCSIEFYDRVNFCNVLRQAADSVAYERAPSQSRYCSSLHFSSVSSKNWKKKYFFRKNRIEKLKKQVLEKKQIKQKATPKDNYSSSQTEKLLPLIRVPNNQTTFRQEQLFLSPTRPLSNSLERLQCWPATISIHCPGIFMNKIPDIYVLVWWVDRQRYCLVISSPILSKVK